MDMKRREFIRLLGGAVAAWPLTVGAQQSPMPVIGYLGSGSATSRRENTEAFERGLLDKGFANDTNVRIDYRWATGAYEQLPALATELVHRRAAVIVAGGIPSALAAKAATASIPIVFTVAFDPVAGGLVTSLNRPGGNLTGVAILGRALGAKRLEFLHEIVPRAAVIGMLVNPSIATFDKDVEELQTVAQARGLHVHVEKANNENDLYAAFANLRQNRVDALFVSGDPTLQSLREQIVHLAAAHAMPAIYDRRSYASAGGLMAYATNNFDNWRQVGLYAGRILQGERPADLPVIQPTKFELVINLKAAKTLGLTVPPTLLARADEVIE